MIGLKIVVDQWMPDDSKIAYKIGSTLYVSKAQMECMKDEDTIESFVATLRVKDLGEDDILVWKPIEPDPYAFGKPDFAKMLSHCVRARIDPFYDPNLMM